MSLPVWDSRDYVLKISGAVAPLFDGEVEEQDNNGRLEKGEETEQEYVELIAGIPFSCKVAYLFRESVTNARLGIGTTLPEPLNSEVQRTWHEKYDALLAKNEQLRREALAAQLRLEKKDREIDELQGKLSSFADSINQRDLAIGDMTSKYLSMKKRAQEQDALLRQCSSLPQNEKKSFMPQTTRYRGQLLEREIQCNIRPTFENSRLRGLLRARKLARNDVTLSNKIS